MSADNDNSYALKAVFLLSHGWYPIYVSSRIWIHQDHRGLYTPDLAVKVQKDENERAERHG